LHDAFTRPWSEPVRASRPGRSRAPVLLPVGTRGPGGRAHSQPKPQKKENRMTTAYMIGGLLFALTLAHVFNATTQGGTRLFPWRPQPPGVVHCANEPPGMAPLERRPTKLRVVRRRSSRARAGRFIGSHIAWFSGKAELRSALQDASRTTLAAKVRQVLECARASAAFPPGSAFWMESGLIWSRSDLNSIPYRQSG
jgi:hypothetical protein